MLRVGLTGACWLVPGTNERRSLTDFAALSDTEELGSNRRDGGDPLSRSDGRHEQIDGQGQEVLLRVLQELRDRGEREGDRVGDVTFAVQPVGTVSLGEDRAKSGESLRFTHPYILGQVTLSGYPVSGIASMS